jgi:hypothetical protein
MSYIIKRNLQDQTIYRFDAAASKCQIASVASSKTIAALTGASADFTINYVNGLLATNPSHWEDIAEAEWQTISSDILTQLDFNLQDDSWNGEASFYFNLASRSCYRWSRSQQKYQAVGMRAADKALIWEIQGPAAVTKIDALESMASKNMYEWIPSNWTQFTMSLVESVQFISPELQ